MSTNGWTSCHLHHHHHCERGRRRRAAAIEIIMNSLSLVSCTTMARQIPVDSTIDNDFSPTESYVVLCPCDKGFQYWSFH
eukprot:scaffold51855_cov50-Attheya_sp.AAC.1